MKNSFFLVVLILLLLESHAISRSIASEPETPFKLQTDNRNRVTIFSETNPVNLTVELNITKVQAKLVLYYQEPRGDQTYNAKTIELVNNGYYNYTVQTNQIKLFLESTDTNYVNYTDQGYYRINYESATKNLTWTPFKLLLSKPDTIDLFKSEGSWINNVSVDIRITELVGGEFYFERANGDVIMMQAITEIGNYSYLVNTSFVTFSLRSENYSRVVGYYTVVDHGKMYQFSMIAGFSFETMMLIIVSSAIVVKYKRKKIEK